MSAASKRRSKRTAYQRTGKLPQFTFTQTIPESSPERSVDCVRHCPLHDDYVIYRADGTIHGPYPTARKINKQITRLAERPLDYGGIDGRTKDKMHKWVHDNPIMPVEEQIRLGIYGPQSRGYSDELESSFAFALQEFFAEQMIGSTILDSPHIEIEQMLLMASFLDAPDQLLELTADLQFIRELLELEKINFLDH